VGEEFVALFPFSFLVWNNSYKERRGLETGRFSRTILSNFSSMV